MKAQISPIAQDVRTWQHSSTAVVIVVQGISLTVLATVLAVIRHVLNATEPEPMNALAVLKMQRPGA